MKIYTLSGTTDKENINRRIAFLTTLLDNAEKETIYLGELRQKNMNCALIIFAAIYTAGLKLSIKSNSVYISSVIVGLMLVFCLLDRRLHKFIHGWGKSGKIFKDTISEIINEPAKNNTFPRYASDAEKEAELYSLQPIIFYLLVLGGFLSFFIL